MTIAPYDTSPFAFLERLLTGEHPADVRSSAVFACTTCAAPFVRGAAFLQYERPPEEGSHGGVGLNCAPLALPAPGARPRGPEDRCRVVAWLHGSTVDGRVSPASYTEWTPLEPFGATIVRWSSAELLVGREAIQHRAGIIRPVLHACKKR